MKLGEKIYQLRNAKKLKQVNLYPANQSMISQIEGDRNTNPTEETLRIIAGNLDISFDELIKDTDWKRPNRFSKKGKYAISQTECFVTIEDSGVINVKMKSYPLYNEAGIENKYDPNTGYKMLVECPKCKRQIETPDQSFCLGCGFKLINMPDLTSLIATAYKNFNGEEVTDQKQIDEYDIRTYQGDVDKNLEKMVIMHQHFMSGITTDLEQNKKAIQIIENKYGEHLLFDQKLSPEKDDLLEGWNSEDINIEYEELLLGIGMGIADSPYGFSGCRFIRSDGKEFDVYGNDFDIANSEFKKPLHDIKILDLIIRNPNEIKNPYLMELWIDHKYNLSLFKGLLNELLRHQGRIIKNTGGGANE